MTELERFAAALLAQWRSEGGGDHESIPVGALLDRVLPYRVARRALGIDSSEDYEALMLSLLAEEEGLVSVSPADAAELAKATSTSRLPDLGVLQLMRSASVTLSERTIARGVGDAPVSSTKGDPKWAAHLEPAAAPLTATGSSSVSAVPNAAACWSCTETLPADRVVKFCPFCGADQRQPTCSACGAVAERGWKHCPECGLKL